jgi:hypothetical protein
MRVYYHHNGGAILTEKILSQTRFMNPIFEDDSKHVYHIAWSDFVYLLEGVIRIDKNEYFDEVFEEEDGSLECNKD